MGFRDPRVLNERLDNNITNAPTAPPSAETAPDSDRAAAASRSPQPYVPDNAYNRPTMPPSVEDETYSHGTNTSVQYQNGSDNTNVTRGPNEKDLAAAPASDTRLLNAKGA